MLYGLGPKKKKMHLCGKLLLDESTHRILKQTNLGTNFTVHWRGIKEAANNELVANLVINRVRW